MTTVLKDSHAARARVVDRTEVMQKVPYQSLLLGMLGIFEDDPRTQKTIEIVRELQNSHIIPDIAWDTKKVTLSGEGREAISISIPHRKAGGSIYPHDIDGVGEINPNTNIMELKTVQAELLKRMQTIRNAHELTLENARMHLLTTGEVLSESGALRKANGQPYNMYTEWGVTRPEVTIPLTGVSDPRNKIAELQRAMREAVLNSGSSLRGIVILCGRNFFDTLRTNPFITDIARQNQTGQLSKLLTGVLTDNNAPLNLDAMYESLHLWGAHFVDASAAGYENNDGEFVPFIKDDEALALPVGISGMFKTYYAPANHFRSVNKVAEKIYWTDRVNEDDDEITYTYESNYLNWCLYPEAVFAVKFS